MASEITISGQTESQIAVSGELGIKDKPVPVEVPKLPKTNEPPRYTVRQQSILQPTGLLPSTGELGGVGYLMIGLFCLVFLLLLRTLRSNSKVSA